MSNKKPKAFSETQQYTILPKQSVKLIGEISGFDDLPNDVIDLLCEEVNYRIREVTQLGLDVMKQAKRRKLLVTDINLALENLDVQPVLGYGVGSEQVNLVPLQGDDLFFPEEKLVNLLETLSGEIPLGCAELPNVKRSWLAVEGRSVSESSEAVSWPSLTEGEKKYLDLIISNLFQVADDQQKEILKNVHKSSFLNHLLPHILDFLIKKTEQDATSNIQHHATVIDFLRALVTNPHVNLLFTPFLDVIVNIIHQFQAGVRSDGMDVWDLQESASHLMSIVIRLWNSPLNNLQESHEEFLLRILSSPTQPLFCYCGAVVGLLSLEIQSLEKALPLMCNILQQTLNDSSPFLPADVARMLEVSKLAFEKLLRHRTIEVTSVQSDCTITDNSLYLTPLKDAYVFFQELFGDSLSIKLPCIDYPSKNLHSSTQEQVTLVLPGKELPEMTGDNLLSGLMDEGKDRSNADDVAIKSTLSDPLHGIKLKISKCSKQMKDAILESSTSDGTFGETKSKKASSESKRNSSSMVTSEMFDEMLLKNREDVIITFRFRNQSNLNTFTEKKKAQILARNMSRQYASTSRYRELCNNLKPYSKSLLLFRQLHTKSIGSHTVVPNAACVI